MKIYRNELTILKGETFALNRTIENENGTPYIVSSELNNPYFLITVTNNLYDEVGKYVYNKWLPLDNFLRFRKVKPILYTYDDWSELPAGYEGNSEEYANEAVFYRYRNGTPEYKYFRYTGSPSQGNYAGVWVDYKFEINTIFPYHITKDWNYGNMYYSIQLVSGNKVKDTLYELADIYGLPHYSDLTTLYNELIDIDEIKDSLANISPVEPIQIDTMYPVLYYSDVYVKSNIKGGK